MSPQTETTGSQPNVSSGRKKNPTDGYSLKGKPDSGSGSGSGSGGSNGDPKVPLPVVLAKGTFLKFALTIGGTVVVGISAVLAFYWQHHYSFVSHMGNQTIHLQSGERARLETKAEAQHHRTKLVKEVKREVEYTHRVIKVRQDEEIKKCVKKMAAELKREQRSEFKRLMDEVRQTRRAVVRHSGD